MSADIPAHFQLQYSADQIAHAVQLMGKHIDAWAEEVWNRSHTDILAIPILRGGIFFFTDLVREISHSVEITPAQSWGYETAQNEILRSEVRIDLSQVPARGREVLLVDDICDSGRTLHTLKSALLDRGARMVKSAVLIHRVLDDLPAAKGISSPFIPDWSAFEYRGREWFVGYGMEDSDRWRNLPGVYIIRSSRGTSS